MLPAPGRPPATAAPRRGAALLLSLLVLFVIVAIVFQINVTTGTDARVARNDVGLTAMDLAIDSALLQVYQDLEDDGQAEAAAGGADSGAAAGANALANAAGGGADPAEGEGGAADGGSEPSDSREDAWARPQQTTFGELDVRLRILVQDEDSKFNLLTLLSDDEERADVALQRLVRILDLCREDTEYDIGTTDAERMARAIRDYLVRRADSDLPRPEQLSYDDQKGDLAAPLSLSELRLLEPFEAHHFRDFRDDRGTIVHSLGSYLTLWSSVSTYGAARGSGGGAQGTAGEAGEGGASNGQAPGGSGQTPGENGQAPPVAGGGGGAGGTGGGGAGGGGAGGGGAGGGSLGGGAELDAGASGPQGGPAGWAINVNTAPAAVLKGLFEQRDLDPRFWDEVIRYRNEEEEEQERDEEEAEPVYDEFGNEVVRLKIFDKPQELAEIPDWIELSGDVREQLDQLVTTKSQVFSIFVTAIQKTSVEEGWTGDAENSRDEFEKSQGNQLVRTVRSVVWRRIEGGEVKIVPLVRWEVLDYVPFEVLDFPEDRR